jgi:D-xylose transport system ATP-binding protein
MLELLSVSKRYGSVQALTGVDFSVNAGEVMALVGDNGAGKSTLIKVIAGAHALDSGTVTVAGRPATIRSPKTRRSSASPRFFRI